MSKVTINLPAKKPVVNTKPQSGDWILVEINNISTLGLVISHPMIAHLIVIYPKDYCGIGWDYLDALSVNHYKIEILPSVTITAER